MAQHLVGQQPWDTQGREETPPVGSLFSAQTVGGEIRLRFEPPDLHYSVYIGDIEEAHFRQLEKFSAFWRRLPYFFTLLDVSQFKSISASARKLAVKMNEGMLQRGFAMVGASTHVRLFGALVMRANELIHGHTDAPTRFFVTEQEGRLWIEERRRRIRASEEPRR